MKLNTIEHFIRNVNQVQKPMYGIQNIKSIQKSSTYVNA